MTIKLSIQSVDICPVLHCPHMHTKFTFQSTALDLGWNADQEDTGFWDFLPFGF